MGSAFPFVSKLDGMADLLSLSTVSVSAFINSILELRSVCPSPLTNGTGTKNVKQPFPTTQPCTSTRARIYVYTYIHEPKRVHALTNPNTHAGFCWVRGVLGFSQFFLPSHFGRPQDFLFDFTFPDKMSRKEFSVASGSGRAFLPEIYNAFM